jgi:hypothetical protein
MEELRTGGEAGWQWPWRTSGRWAVAAMEGVDATCFDRCGSVHVDGAQGGDRVPVPRGGGGARQEDLPRVVQGGVASQRWWRPCRAVQVHRGGELRWGAIALVKIFWEAIDGGSYWKRWFFWGTEDVGPTGHVTLFTDTGRGSVGDGLSKHLMLKTYSLHSFFIIAVNFLDYV